MQRSESKCEEPGASLGDSAANSPVSSRSGAPEPSPRCAECLARTEASAKPLYESPTNVELAKRNEKLSALVDVAETVSHSLDLQTVLNDALGKVLEIVAMETGEIFILDAETGRLLLKASRGGPPSADGISFSIGEGVPGLVAEAAQPLVIHDSPDDARYLRSANQPMPHALIGIPLMARGQVVGVMNLFCISPCPYRQHDKCTRCVSPDPEEISLLLAMGQQIGMAIENARLWEELKRKEKNRTHLLKQVIAAQEEERKRIARELHDGAGQSLTSLMIGLKRLQSAETHAETTRLSAELRDMVAQTLDEVHTLALELRPSMIDDMGLSVALQRYCTDYERRTGIAVDYHRDGLCAPRLPGSVEITIYRIVQEALTNVIKHATAANVSVLLRASGGRLRAIVEDDGIGFDVAATLEDAPDERKLGLVGMRERANLLGGTCTIESRPGAGCTVFVEVPIPLEGDAYE